MTKAKADYIFLGLLGALLVATLIRVATTDYVLNIRNYFAIAGWTIALVLRLLEPKVGRYALAVIIVLGVFGLMRYFIDGSSFFMSYRGDKETYSTPGIDTRLMLIFIPYYIVNRRKINIKIAQLFRGTPEDREAEHQKMVLFYTDKFKELPAQDFAAISKNIDAYPEAAQTAIRAIASGRPV